MRRADPAGAAPTVLRTHSRRGGAHDPRRPPHLVPVRAPLASVEGLLGGLSDIAAARLRVLGVGGDVVESERGAMRVVCVARRSTGASSG